MGIYCVCWKDGLERGTVKGEENMDAWAEAEEVCSYFRAGDDGLKYYVGDKDANPLTPTVEEAMWSLKYNIEAGYISPAEYKLLEYFVDRVADFERGREAMRLWHKENPELPLLEFDDDEV